jgi:hypothetical protein
LTNRSKHCLLCAARFTLLCILAWLCLLGQPLLASADDGLRAVDNTYKVQFGSSITFHLEIEADNDVAEVTLYYRREGEGVTVMIPISASSSDRSFHHTWELEPGEVPVGERIEYEWRVVDTAGNELRTSPLELEYADDRFDWQRIAEDNVILFWYGTSEGEARGLLGYALESLARLQEEMGVVLKEPVRIYAYRSKSDMSLALPRQSDAYDDRILTLGVVVDEATLLLLGPHSAVAGTIAHELSHIVVGLATDNPYAAIPRWLDEGLAMYAEGELPAGNRRALQSAIERDQLISVRSLSGYTGDPTQVDLFYGEVYSLIDYLLQSYGADKMTQLLDAFTEGITQEEALQRVYGFGVDELDAHWRQSLGLEARGTPSPTTAVSSRPIQRPSTPCPVGLLAAFGSVAVVALEHKRARTP